MENPLAPSTRSGQAKDFFLHLGMIAGLYAVAIALVNLLFTVIDYCYPALTQYNYYSSSSISLPTATLIIIFPIFLLLSKVVYRSLEVEPEKKHLGVRRWLTYITLFVAGIILASDLVTVLYKFLDGQDLTLAFVLKALVVFILTGAIFKFYLDEIRDRVSGKARKVWAIISTVAIIISIVLGFSVIGSPSTQRMTRYDEQKVNDLQNIQWQIISYWQRKGSLPAKLSEIADPISGYVLPKDAQTGQDYEYMMTGKNGFQLCASFNKSTIKFATRMEMKPAMMNENWNHETGRTCFDRTIDSTLYPVNGNMGIPKPIQAY